jgi:hypothetical protein
MDMGVGGFKGGAADPARFWPGGASPPRVGALGVVPRSASGGASRLPPPG